MLSMSEAGHFFVLGGKLKFSLDFTALCCLLMEVAYHDTLHFLIADLNLHLFTEMLK